MLSEENSNLNARLQEFETVKAHKQQLLVDNDNLQKRNKDLGDENSAQLVEIERLSTENRLLRGLLKSDNTRRHKSNRSSDKKKKAKKRGAHHTKKGKESAAQVLLVRQVLDKAVLQTLEADSISAP